MKIDIISFTDHGQRLAELLADKLEATSAPCGEGKAAGHRNLHKAVTSTRCGTGGRLREWAAEAFANADALIYVGAVGICVRSIAPHIRSKTTDPAVVVVDETGKYVIPILSGHLGGANDLARRLASITGGEAVITTATDRNGVFSVDAWARIQGCAVENPGKIKDVSMKILNGRDIVVESDFPIEGTVPEHVILKPSPEGTVPDAVLTIRRTREKNPIECRESAHISEKFKKSTHETPLHLVPRIVCAGVGCRKNIPVQNVENAIRSAFEQAGVSELALCGIFSIDLKKEEDGLKEFCRRRKIPFVTFSAEQLAAVQGEFTSSAFVREVAGVDNVCERSAVLGAETESANYTEPESERGNSGTPLPSKSRLILRKYICDGVTVALTVRDFRPDFRWIE